jgi:hypothetical protein
VGPACLNHCRGQPWGSPKQLGENPHHLVKNAKRELIHEPKNACTKQPYSWWPPWPAAATRLNAPSGEVCLARGLNAPSGEVSLARELNTTSGEVRLVRGLSAPRARVERPSGEVCLARGSPRARRPRSCTHVRAFNALAPQDYATTPTRLGITPQRCSTHSLGKTIPATIQHCAERLVSAP